MLSMHYNYCIISQPQILGPTLDLSDPNFKDVLNFKIKVHIYLHLCSTIKREKKLHEAASL